MLAENIKERLFLGWYEMVRKRVKEISGFELNPNPYDPLHFYDYKKAFESGAVPDNKGHLPSKFKKEGHPRQYINQKGGLLNTITNTYESKIGMK